VEDWVYSIDGSPDTRFTAYTSGGKLEFFDHPLQNQQTLAEEMGHIFSIRFDPSNRLLATVNSKGSLSL
jgi:hypothetical protein